MQSNVVNLVNVSENCADNVKALEKQSSEQLDTLVEDLKRLLTRHHDSLKEGGVRREMQQLERWLEAECEGPAPAGVISESGMKWLECLRDKLKLSADEALRLEGEGGNPSNTEQAEKIDAVLKTIRRIDKIINESATTTAH